MVESNIQHCVITSASFKGCSVISGSQRNLIFVTNLRECAQLQQEMQCAWSPLQQMTAFLLHYTDLYAIVSATKGAEETPGPGHVISPPSSSSWIYVDQ